MHQPPLPPQIRIRESHLSPEDRQKNLHHLPLSSDKHSRPPVFSHLLSVYPGNNTGSTRRSPSLSDQGYPWENPPPNTLPLQSLASPLNRIIYLTFFKYLLPIQSFVPKNHFLYRILTLFCQYYNRDVSFATRSALMSVTKGTPHDKRNVPQFKFYVSEFRFSI